MSHDGDLVVGTIRWFGPGWGSMVNHPETRVELPADQACLVCEEVIEESRNGIRLPFLGREAAAPFVYYHLECFVEVVLPEG